MIRQHPHNNNFRLEAITYANTSESASVDLNQLIHAFYTEKIYQNTKHVPQGYVLLNEDSECQLFRPSIDLPILAKSACYTCKAEHRVTYYFNFL